MSAFEAALLWMPMLAVVAVLVRSLVGRIAQVPLVVFEILLGIVVGPNLLGWVGPTDFAATLSQFGLAMLFFMAGSEIDFAAIRGRPLNRAAIGWLISLVVGVGVGVALAPTPVAGVFIGIALSSTALGTILPMLRDAGELTSPFGRAVTAIGAAGEFGPLLAISLFLSGRNPSVAALIVVVFAGLAALAIWAASRGNHIRLHGLVRATIHTSGQIGVRLVLFIVSGLAVVSVLLGLDMLLGAFVAGVLWRVFISRAPEVDRENVESKIEGVAFGFLVPVFFIYTGITFNLSSLIAEPVLFAYVPLFAALLLVIRGFPGLLVAPKGSSRADKRAIMLFSGTALPIVVAVTSIGTESKLLTEGLAAAMVAGGMLTVLLFPLLGLLQRRRSVTLEESAVVDA